MLDDNDDRELYIKGFDFKTIRTGSIGDGSCFLHSMFRSINEEQYLGLGDKKKDYVEFARKDLASKITLDDWFKYRNGIIADVSITKVFIRTLKQIRDDSLKLDFTKDIKLTKKDLTSFLQDLSGVLSKPMKDFSKNLSEINHPYSELFLKIFEFSKKKSYDKFIKNLSNRRENITDFTAMFFQDAYNINVIYVKNGKFTSLGDCDFLIQSENKFILMNYIDQIHFESIAVVTPEKDKIRLFNRHDPIIEEALKLLCF